MITVAILINGQPIMARSARNTGFTRPCKGDWKTIYNCDDGSQVLHNPEDGAVALAIKMLRTIKEPK